MEDITMTNLTKPIRFASVFLTAVLLSVLLAGCGGGESIVGTWVYEEGSVVEFFDDGSCDAMDVAKYEATENGKLTLYDEYDDPVLVGYYKVDGDKLYIDTSKEGLAKHIERSSFEDGDYFKRQK
jgi:hypothetical protein